MIAVPSSRLSAAVAIARIRTLLIPALAFIVLAANPVRAIADITTTFDVAATLSLAGSAPPGFTCNSCGLAGTITIDFTTGSVSSAAITAPGINISGHMTKTF